MHVYRDPLPFVLEGGSSISQLEIAYHTYGTLSATGDNVVWICHALTGNSDAATWWSRLVGPGRVIDTNSHFVVCANMIGSCYGSTGPTTVTDSGSPLYRDFPLVTARDQVRAFIRLRKELGISHIRTLIGGSMGGQHVLEWALLETDVIERIVPIATSAKHSPWAIAFNSAQRLALEADPTFNEPRADAGGAGLIAARAIGMISYRTPVLFNVRQREEDERIDDFHADSYQRHQGNKLAHRFSAHAYHTLTRAMDSHDLGRNRNGVGAALRSITARTVVIGIDSDLLFPESEQQFISDMITRSKYRRLSSASGHDAFLIDQRKLSIILQQEKIFS
ncbi:MAG: homoserine O-acetyltransferase [Candidatus Kapabacteria bacterium]|nr:homoserine O-acetyltransferase [Candidatus Kapabacteria bacterium]